MDGEEIVGAFYRAELQKVNNPRVKQVEKVLQTRRNKKEVLVRWLGWPKKFDSWIPYGDLQKKYKYKMV